MKKSLLVIIAAIVLIFISFSPSSSGAKGYTDSTSALSSLYTAYSYGLIDYETFMLYRFLSVVDPDRVPSQFKVEEERTIHRCATQEINEVQRYINYFSPENKKKIMEYLFDKQPIAFKKGTGKSYKTERIEGINGTWNIYRTDNFAIKWGDVAYEYVHVKVKNKWEWKWVGVNLVDDNNNGFPDIIDKWAEYLEKSWEVEVNEMGLIIPRGSQENLIDIYIANSSGRKPKLGPSDYAYTTTYSDGMPYLVVNNFLPETPNQDPAGQEIGAIKVTAAHEFSHAIQFAYDRNEAKWWQEASATWMEDRVFNEVNDYYQYLSKGAWSANPEITLTRANGEHEYGDVIWAKYLSQYYGGREIFKDIWELCKKYSALKAHKIFFKNKVTTLDKAFEDFSAKNAAMKASYEEGENYASVHTIMEHDAYSVNNEVIDSSKYFPRPPSYLGANYIKFTNGDGRTLRITFDGSKRYAGRKIKWGAVVVKIDSNGIPEDNEIELSPDQKGSIDILGFGSTYTEVYLVLSVLSGGPGNFSKGVSYRYSAELQ